MERRRRRPPARRSRARSEPDRSGRRAESDRTHASPADDIAAAAARVATAALAALEERSGTGVPLRRLVNFLRASEAAPRSENGASDRASGREASTASLESLHGVLWAVSATWVAELVEGLLEEGYVETVPERLGRLRLTDLGARLADGRESALRSILPRRARLGECPEVEERLRALRKRIALEENRPAFSVFDNRALAQLAAEPPANLGELAAVPGFGEERVRRYGRRILRALRRPSS